MYKFVASLKQEVTKSAKSVQKSVAAMQTKGSTGELHAAAMEGNVAAVQALLDKGVDPNSPNKDKFTPLYTAAVNGRLAVVEFLCQRGVNLNKRTVDGYTPLIGAAMYGHVEVVRYLCNQKANVNAWTKKKLIPPPAEEAASGKKKGKKQSAPSKPKFRRFGETPLHIAAAAGQAEICAILCRRRANVHNLKKDGSTPLHCVGSRLDFVQQYDLVNTIVVLLQHGAKFSDRNKDNKSAATVLANRFPDQFVTMMETIRAEHPELIPVRDIDGLTLSRDEWRMVLNRLPIRQCKLFLLGNGGSGKSSLSAALQSQRKPNDPDETDDNPKDVMTRTYGVEYSLFGIKVGDEEPDRFCIQDPGGHYQPHVVHPLLFQAAYGIYMILVRVDLHTPWQVKEQVSYWLKFVHACARPGGHVMLVFSGWSKGTYIEDKLAIARAEIAEYPQRRKDLVFEETIWFMDCRKSMSEEIGRLRLHLSHVSRGLQEKHKYTMPYACGAVQDFMNNKRITRTADNESKALVSSVRDLHLDFKLSAPTYAFISEALFVRLCEYLQQTGTLLLLPGSWAVLDANIVTKHIFGQLFRQPMRLQMGESEHMLTVKDIEGITAGRYWFDNEEVVPMLMQEFDLCVEYPTANFDPVVRFFPCFTQPQLTSPAEELAILRGRPNLGVRIRFEDPDCLSYRLDFTARLFMELYLALTPPSNPNSKSPQLWSNAALLKARATVRPTMGADAEDAPVFHKWVLIERHPPSTPGFDVICACDPFDVARVAELLDKAALIIQNLVGVTCERFALSPNPELLSVANREAFDEEKLKEIQQEDAALYQYLTTGAGSASPTDPHMREVLDNLYDTRAQLNISVEQLKHMESKFNDLQTRFQFPEEYYPTPVPVARDLSHSSGISRTQSDNSRERKLDDGDDDDDDVDDLDDLEYADDDEASTPTRGFERDDDGDEGDGGYFDNQSDYDGRSLHDEIDTQPPEQPESAHYSPATLQRDPSNFLDQPEGDIP